MQSRCAAAGVHVTFEPDHHPEYELIPESTVDQHGQGAGETELESAHLREAYGRDPAGGLFDFSTSL